MSLCALCGQRTPDSLCGYHGAGDPFVNGASWAARNRIILATAAAVARTPLEVALDRLPPAPRLHR